MARLVHASWSMGWDKAPPIGIDLGTTNSRAAVYQNDRVSIIPIDKGNRTTASCVAFTEPANRRFLIGDAARSQVALNPEKTIFDLKRMIGRKFDDPKFRQDIENWPFNVVNEDGKPKIHAKVLGKKNTFIPEEIVAILLYQIKSECQKYFEKDVVDVVISVPACFNVSQRQATKNAAQIAGLNVIMVMNEPTAAALAYGLEENLRGNKSVLIFDLGGGKLDASVIKIKDGLRIKVKSTAGDSHLGGEDFDNVLVAHFVEEFNRMHQRDLRTCPKALGRLRIACEEAKRTLSSCFEATIDIIGLFEGINFHSKLTRTQFEDMCMDLFRSTLEPVERALSDAEMDKGTIDEVVLVGGSTRIPKIRELLKDFFDGKEPLSISPDEAVAYGAAVKAAVTYVEIPAASRVAVERIRSVSLSDITPFSLGIETDGGVMTPIFKRNSKLRHCYCAKVFTTDVDNQSNIDVDVYEGEQAMAKDNRLVGRFTIENIPPVPKGVPQFEVTLWLDEAGLNQPKLRHKPPRLETDVRQSSLVTDLGGLPEDDIESMNGKAQHFRFVEMQRRGR